MTEVNFHHGAADPLAYACKLLLKAYQRGARVVVTGTAQQLAELDVALWTFDDLAFVPHVRLADGAAPPPRWSATPIWLLAQPAEAPHHEVLVNLGPEVAVGFESFERVFEVVGRSDAARLAGRERWRHFESRGYEIKRYEVPG